MQLVGIIFIALVVVICFVMMLMIITTPDEPKRFPIDDKIAARAERVRVLDELEQYCERQRSWVVKQESITTSYKNGQLVQINRMLDQIARMRERICNEGTDNS